jgi:hypothetical protein
MKITKISLGLWALTALMACQGTGKKNQHMKVFEKGTFGYDLEFLNGNDSIIVLKSEDGKAQVAVSPKYQGKVFTSTAAGPEGKSFGWINYKAFGKPLEPHMNGYGGEDRLWLGPEGGKFSVFFKPGDSMVFDNWHTPKGVDSESWTLVSSDANSVSMHTEMELRNYAGTNLKIKLERTVSMIERTAAEQLLNIHLDPVVNTVAFKTLNTIINQGESEWTEKTGAPCLWNLDMFSPSPGTVIIMPYIEDASGKIATTNYFGEIPKDRIAYKKGVLLYKADGKSRGKLGIPPARAKNIAGSYSPDQQVLTVTLFDVDNMTKYLNQEWVPDKDPMSGDAVNAYNDGPLADGTQMGPFYELESVSPPAFLKPGARHTHMHSVFHFTGNKTALDEIAKKIFGISLDEVTKTF